MVLSLSNLREVVKDREAWRAAVHGLAKSRTRLSDRTAAITPVHGFVTANRAQTLLRVEDGAPGGSRAGTSVSWPPSFLLAAPVLPGVMLTARGHPWSCTVHTRCISVPITPAPLTLGTPRVPHGLDHLKSRQGESQDRTPGWARRPEDGTRLSGLRPGPRPVRSWRRRAGKPTRLVVSVRSMNRVP